MVCLVRPFASITGNSYTLNNYPLHNISLVLRIPHNFAGYQESQVDDMVCLCTNE
jgi:hypothetical protein